VSDSTKATVSASSSAPNGTQTLKINSIAQAAYLTSKKFADSVSTSTTLAELGFTGSGNITLAKGDGTAANISVSSSTTVSEFLVSLKEQGLTANYDDTNKRIYISASGTGSKNDFDLIGADTSGADALYKLGLSVDTTSSSGSYYDNYKKYKTYTDATGTTTSTEASVKKYIEAYNAAQAEYDAAATRKANEIAAYSYGTSYRDYNDAMTEYKNVGGSYATQLEALLKTSDGGSTSFAVGNKSYSQYATTSDGVLFRAGDTNDYILRTEDTSTGSSVYTYYTVAAADISETYTAQDASGNDITFTKQSDGTYKDGNGDVYDYADGVLTKQSDTSVTYSVGTTPTYSVTSKGATTSVTTLDAIKADIQSKMGKTEAQTNTFVSTLSSNNSAITSYEAGITTDTAVDDSDRTTYEKRQEIVDAVKTAYAADVTNGNTDAMTAFFETIDHSIEVNAQTMKDKQDYLDGNVQIASLVEKYNANETAQASTTVDADAKDTAQETYDNALASFVTQVDNAYSMSTSTTSVKYNDKDDDPSNFAVKISGTDSEIELNGITYTSTQNSYTINGLTINALQKTTGDGITITTATDTQGIYDKIKEFLTKYNTLINEMTSLYNADSSSGYEPLTDDEKDAMSDTEIEKWETKIKDSLLRRDTTLQSIMSAMTSAMSSGYKVTVNGVEKTYYLSTFGIKTLGYLNAPENQYNAYHIDGDEDDTSTSSNEDKLMAAISSDPDTVISFMQQLVQGLYTSIGDKMKSTTLSSSYTVYNDKEMASEYSDYTETISKWEEKLEDQEDYWYDKFSSMETALAKLNSQTSSLSSLFG
jgi:flagellar hook-associated protein 2